MHESLQKLILRFVAGLLLARGAPRTPRLRDKSQPCVAGSPPQPATRKQLAPDKTLAGGHGGGHTHCQVALLPLLHLRPVRDLAQNYDYSVKGPLPCTLAMGQLQWVRLASFVLCFSVAPTHGFPVLFGGPSATPDNSTSQLVRVTVAQKLEWIASKDAAVKRAEDSEAAGKVNAWGA